MASIDLTNDRLGYRDDRDGDGLIVAPHRSFPTPTQPIHHLPIQHTFPVRLSSMGSLARVDATAVEKAVMEKSSS